MADFKNPPSHCRPILQWSWNGNLDRERIDAVIEQCVEQGMGGFFTHVRPGLTISYLGGEWFSLWDYAARRCSEARLQWNIYDEFTVGGGAAGGHTVARMPQLVQRELAVVPVVDAGQAIKASEYYRFDEATRGASRIASDEVPKRLEKGERVLAAVVQIPPGGERQNALGPVDLYHPDAAPEFIASTHAKYAEKSGDLFGTTVRFCFNDEPHTTESRTAYPFSNLIAREFWLDHGYAIEAKLQSLLFWEEDSEAVRYDFYRTLNRLYCHGYVKPLHDWCEAHGLEFTGHFMEHLWPRPIGQPNAMAALRWMQAPGNDLLGARFSTASLRENALYLLNLKELSSVANQFDRKNVMVESSGAGGWHRSFDLFKPCEDFLLSFGVTVMDPHLSHYSIAGARKYDYGQSLSDHSHWWKLYRSHADHVGRAIAAQREAKEFNRVLVLHPTTTAWLYHQPQGYPWRGSDNDRRLSEMADSHAHFLRKLYSKFIDFDLGDELILEEVGRVAEGQLAVGSRHYDVVVIPPDLETLSSKNLSLLRTWLAGGGEVLECGSRFSRIDGRLSEEPMKARLAFKESWRCCASVEELTAAVVEMVPPRIGLSEEESESSGLVWRRSCLPNGDELYFLCNPWERELAARIALPIGQLLELDTATGDIIGAFGARDRDQQWVTLRLPPRGHRLFMLGGNELEGKRLNKRRAGARNPVEFLGANMEGPNLLNVDYCDLESEGRSLVNVPTVVADKANWAWQGFSCSPWLMTAGMTPFGGDIERVTLSSRSRLRMRYAFDVDPSLALEQLRGISLGVERPWFYEIQVNGKELDQVGGEKWLDPEMRQLPLGELLVKGENTVELAAERFHVHCELAPIYLLGDFSLEAANRGFRITRPRAIGLGDWTMAGYPFYDGIVTYRYRVGCVGGSRRLRVTLGEWKGSAVTVSWDGKAVGNVIHPPFMLEFQNDQARDVHTLELSVYGITQNKLGPYFVTDCRHTVAAWMKSPLSMPPGNEYKFLPSGLMVHPQLHTLT